MDKPVIATEQASDFRQRAEDLASRHAPPPPLDPETTLPVWASEMVHELRVHQIELEMQNEELRTAQVALGEAHARYFDLYHLAPVGYFTLSEAGVIQEANQAAASRLGMSRGDLVHQPFSKFIFREDQDTFYLQRKRLPETGTPGNWNLRMVRQDGAEFPVRLDASVAQEANGSLVLRLTMSDLSRDKGIEDPLRYLETEVKNTQGKESLDVQASGLVRDLNNVLGAILELASTDLDAQASDGRSRRTFRTIANAAEHGVRMAQGLTNLARRNPIENLAPEPGTDTQGEVQPFKPATEKVQPGVGVSNDFSPWPEDRPPRPATDSASRSRVVSSRKTSIRAARSSDIPGIVEVHLASFQNFFLTFLGRSFLELLYREVTCEARGVFLVATSPENAVIGFAAGVFDLPAFYRRVAKEKWLKFALASMNAALRSPSIIPRLWRALGSAGLARKAPCPATLMSIAVAPGAKRTGVGESLIACFLTEMKLHGAQAICLTTDRDNNSATIAFYEKLGFRKSRDYQTREGRWIREYSIDT